jgi:hypothetical protein
MTARQIFAGVGLALLGHVVMAVVPLIIVYTIEGYGPLVWSGIAGQSALFIGCVVGGIVLLVRDRRRGVGLGLLIGWVVGFLVIPAISFILAFGVYPAISG